MSNGAESPWDGEAFATKLGQQLDEHLKTRGVLAHLVDGGAFELWLAMESRLLIEQDRKGFQADGVVDLTREGQSLQMPRVWVACEFSKVDLVLLEYSEKSTEVDGPWSDALACCEFKLIWNNKNWPDQVMSIGKDFVGKDSSGHEVTHRKQEMHPRSNIAIVGVTSKNYHFSGGYVARSFEQHGKKPDLMTSLKTAMGGVEPTWESERHLISTDGAEHVSPWLKTTEKNYFQLLVYCRNEPQHVAV